MSESVTSNLCMQNPQLYIPCPASPRWLQTALFLLIHGLRYTDTLYYLQLVHYSAALTSVWRRVGRNYGRC